MPIDVTESLGEWAGPDACINLPSILVDEGLPSYLIWEHQAEKENSRQSEVLILILQKRRAENRHARVLLISCAST